MSDGMNGWKAHVEQDITTGRQAVTFYRRAGEGTEIIVGVDEHGGAIIRRYDLGVQPDTRGLLLPDGCAEALAAVVRPGPSEREVDLLREWLDTERERVERVLDSAIERIGVSDE